MVKYNIGDKISSSQPLVYVVDDDNKEKVCHYCLSESSTLQRCSACCVIFYCSKKCQKMDWKSIHKHECEYAKTYYKNADCEYERLGFRLLLKSELGDNAPFTTHDSQQAVIDDLPQTTNNPLLLEVFKKISLTFEENRAIFKQANFDQKLVHKRIQQAVVNSSVISHDKRRLQKMSPVIALGVFSDAFLKICVHSCLPNAICVPDGNKMIVRALKNIDTENEPVRVATAIILTKKAKRQKLLCFAGIYNCQCNGCEGPDFLRDEDYDILDSSFTVINHGLVYSDFWLEAVLVYIKKYIEMFGVYHFRDMDSLILERIAIAIDENDISPGESELRDLFFNNLKITHGEDHSYYKHCSFIIQKGNFTRTGKFECKPGEITISPVRPMYS